MSTSAAIIEKTETGYRGIYCNFDGYPAGVGKILKEHYQDPVKVSELIDLGEISSLGKRVDPIAEHSWKNPEQGTTVAYHRDRGEKLILAKGCETYKEVVHAIGANYSYLFEDSIWKLNDKSL